MNADPALVLEALVFSNGIRRGESCEIAHHLLNNLTPQR